LWLKLCSGPAATPVLQAADRPIVLVIQ